MAGNREQFDFTFAFTEKPNKLRKSWRVCNTPRKTVVALITGDCGLLDQE